MFDSQRQQLILACGIAKIPHVDDELLTILPKGDWHREFMMLMAKYHSHQVNTTAIYDTNVLLLLCHEVCNSSASEIILLYFKPEYNSSGPPFWHSSQSRTDQA